MTTIWIATGLLGALGVLLAFSGVGGMRRRPMSGGIGALLGVLLVASAGLVGLVGLNMRTYDRLTYEQYVAQIEFAQLGPQDFEATVRTPDGEERTFEIKGDDWQMDARVLKFPGWANVAGIDAVYRLDRLGGRYEDVDQERTAPRTIYALSDDPGIDVWKLARGRGKALNIDASFGSAVYHPMADGAQFEVNLTQTSLVSRPLNAEATQAVSRWDGRNPPPPLLDDELIAEN